MTTNDLLEALARLRVETGSLACLGCGREHNCSTHGCAILRAAADLIERLTAENAKAEAKRETENRRGNVSDLEQTAIARVFPRKTNASPTDALAFFREPTSENISDCIKAGVTKVHISVTFTWDLERAE